MLSRLAIACYRHRRRVLLAWVALVVAAVIVGPGLAGRWTNSGRLPGTDSQAAQDVLAAQFPTQAGEGIPHPDRFAEQLRRLLQHLVAD